MKAALANIADINLGYSFRGRIEADRDGDVLIVQAKDLSESGEVELSEAIRKSDVPIRSSLLLRTGDVLLQTRGVTYRAALVEKLDWPAVAAAPVYVIRSDPARVRAPYLVAFFNDPQTQGLLRQAATGTHVPQVPRGALEALEIPLPTLSDQDALGELARLVIRKKKIEEALNVRMLALVRALSKARAHISATPPTEVPESTRKARTPVEAR